MSDQFNGSVEAPARSLRKNIEIKARIADLAAARSTAERVATSRLGILEQTDTYFKCQTGRLKLREILGQPSELIWYRRPDETGARKCEFGLIEVDDPEAVKLDLGKLLGLWKVVKKSREVFLYHNVRIHLDNVDCLGTFLEFEAIVDQENDEQAGARRLGFLCDQFGLSASDFIAGSYSDMLNS